MLGIAAAAPSAFSRDLAAPVARSNALLSSDPVGRWVQANPFAIQIDASQDAWHAGHVSDVLVAGLILIVGTDSGGVWLVFANDVAIPLSDDWDNPDVTCLAVGPDDPQHIYAGCGNSGSVPTSRGGLYETDASMFAPLLRPWREIALPDAMGSVYRIGVLKSARRIVLACDGGIWWSPIPQPGGVYTWKQAQGLPPDAFFGLAVGPDNTVAVAAWGSNPSTGLYGIFSGSWQATSPSTPVELVMTRAHIAAPGDITAMCATSLASCENLPNHMYAVSSSAEGQPLFVLRSFDGGKNWFTCGFAIEGAPAHDPPWDIRNAVGGQGNGWNNCIGVSPFDPNIVGFGWVAPLLSTNGGQSWRMVGGQWISDSWWDVSTPHVHKDLHAIYFDPTDSSGQRVYFASDGGVTISADLGNTFSSGCNRALRNLEFLGPSASREWYGTLAASYQIAGLIAGGLQDNGCVYALAAPQATPWHMVFDGDGGPMIALRTGDLLGAAQGDGLHRLTWNAAGNSLVDQGVIPARKNGQDDPTRIGGVVEIVNAPVWRNSNNQLMYALAGLGTDVYGLFANDDATDMHWEFLASLPVATGLWISTLGSSRGLRVFVGTDDGHIFLLNPTNDTFEVAKGLPPAPGSIVRLIVQTDMHAFALYDTSQDGGQLYRTADGVNWSISALIGGGYHLPDETFYAMETDWTTNPKTLFVATDSRVYMSSDDGYTWQSVSQGLPRRPHCADLRFVLQADGTRYLYLSTFGRSVWRVRLPIAPQAPSKVYLPIVWR